MVLKMVNFLRRTSTQVVVAISYMVLGVIIGGLYYSNPNALGAIGIIFTSVGIGLMLLIEVTKD